MKPFIQMLIGDEPMVFLATLFIAYLTAFTMLLLKTTRRDPTSTRTPFDFSWTFLIIDKIKVIIGNLLLILLAVRFAPQFFPGYPSFTGFAIGLLSCRLLPLAVHLQERIYDYFIKSVNSKTDL